MSIVGLGRAEKMVCGAGVNPHCPPATPVRKSAFKVRLEPAPVSWETDRAGSVVAEPLIAWLAALHVEASRLRNWVRNRNHVALAPNSDLRL
jgi:hypothetical protein